MSIGFFPMREKRKYANCDRPYETSSFRVQKKRAPKNPLIKTAV